MKDYALCPFFENVNNTNLICEHGQLSLPDKSDKDMWLKMHCCTWNFKICVFYKELMEKYDS